MKPQPDDHDKTKTPKKPDQQIEDQETPVLPGEPPPLPIEAPPANPEQAPINEVPDNPKQIVIQSARARLTPDSFSVTGF